MLRKSLEYGTALIALYLVVAHASGAGELIAKGAAGSNTLVHAFQGR